MSRDSCRLPPFARSLGGGGLFFGGGGTARIRQDARDPLVGNAARLPLCTVEHDVDSQTHAASSAQTLGMPTSAWRCRCMHGSCSRAAGCGAGTRRGGRPRTMHSSSTRGRPHSAAEGADGDGAGAGRPDRTSNRAGGQHRLGVSARHAPGVLEEDMGVGGVQTGYDLRCRQSGARALQIPDSRRSGRLATQSERRANLCA